MNSEFKKVFTKNIESILVSAIIIISLIEIVHILHESKDRYIDIILGATVGIIVSFVVRLPAFIERQYHKLGERGRFQKVFGTAAVRGNITLLFPHRELSAPALQSLATYYDPLKDPKSSSQLLGRVPIPENIDLWLPLQDFRGANHVAAEIARVTGNTAQYRTDRSIADLGFDDLFNTVVSFGLGFNGFTHTIEELTEGKLFYVTWGESQRADSKFEPTDNFVLPVEDFPKEKITGSYDYALVARVCCKQPDGKPSRFFFICAGRTASGTAAAGYFLANKWKEIYKMYVENGKDFDRHCIAIVVKHWFGHGANTLNAAKDADSTASFYETGPEKKLLLNWLEMDYIDGAKKHVYIESFLRLLRKKVFLADARRE